MIRVLLADDHKIFLQGLISLLQSAEDLEIVGTVADGSTALQMILQMKPDIAVLDISMPEMDGIHVAQHLRDKKSATQIIFLTYHKENLVVSRALKAGAKGFLLKENTFEELLRAIRKVKQGGTFICPSIASELINYQLSKDNVSIKLTKRQEEILRWITLGKSNKEIAMMLHISIKTVETHRSRILGKLKTNHVADLVRYALRIGLIDLHSA